MYDVSLGSPVIRFERVSPPIDARAGRDDARETNTNKESTGRVNCARHEKAEEGRRGSQQG